MDVYFYGLILSSYDEGNATDGNILFILDCIYFWKVFLFILDIVISNFVMVVHFGSAVLISEFCKISKSGQGISQN